MRALILAAGSGTRLQPEGGPKCLVKIGGRPLIEHQLDTLWGAGLEHVVIVVGCEQARVRGAIDGRATIVVNHRYTETDSLYSFLLARDEIDGDDVLVLNSDVLCHPDIVSIVAHESGSAVAYDSRSGKDGEAMKVELRGGRLVRMSKGLPARRSSGENVGVIRLDRRAALSAFRVALTLIDTGGGRDWLASAINIAAATHLLRAIDVADLPWIEIDFPDDLEHARRSVWPAIRASREPASALVG